MLPIYVLEKDNSHPGNVTREQINLTFGNRAIQTTDPADIPWDRLAESAALYVFEKENSIIQPDGTVWNWITPEREKALWEYVNDGGHVLFLHNGMVGFPMDSLWHQMAGGLFVRHPVIQNVKYAPLPKQHPILEGVKPFEGDDEHYFTRIRLDEVELLMGGHSAEGGTSIAGWCRQIGKGRVASLTPGHTFDIVRQKELILLVRNAASWVTGEAFSTADL